MPGLPGYYALYQGREVVYVGSTTDLQMRLGKHLSERRPYEYEREDRLVYPKNPITRAKFKVSRRLGDWLMGEWHLITRLQPKRNILGVARRA